MKTDYTFEVERMARDFARWGVEPRILRRPGALAKLWSDVGKDAVHPISEVPNRMLLDGSAFWVGLWRKDRYIACISAKYSDIGELGFGEYWAWYCGNQYKGQPNPVLKVSDPLVDLLRGRLVYFGGVQVAEGNQGSLAQLGALVAWCKLNALISWEFDSSYTIINRAHRPLARVYKFQHIVANAVTWAEPVPDGLASDQIFLVSSQRDLVQKLSAKPAKLGEDSR